MKSLISAFNRFVRNNSLLKRRDHILVAVSGGPDSVALLRLLLIVRKNWSLKLSVAHLNHGLRGKESDADAIFVRKLAHSFQLPFYSKKVFLKKKIGRRKRSLEEAARDVRYRFLFQTARKYGCHKIATAHTLDDQAETVMMRMIRGTGFKGLSSIPTFRQEKGITIVRPLLNIQKRDLLAFLENQGLTYRKDSTNETLVPLRNRVRLELMPFIERRYNPKFKLNLVNLAQLSEKLYDFIHKEARRVYRRISRKASKGVQLSLPKLRRIHPVLRTEIYFLAMQSVVGHRKSLDKIHIDTLDSLLALNQRKHQYLPKKFNVRQTKSSLILSRT